MPTLQRSRDGSVHVTDERVNAISLAPTLRDLAEDARREAADRALAGARRVGVRSVVPLMVCFLPAFVLVGVVPIIAGLLAGLVG